MTLSDLQPEVNDLFQDILSFLNGLNVSSIPKPLSSQANLLAKRIEKLCPPAPPEVLEDDQDIYDEASGDDINVDVAPELPGRPIPAQLPSPAASTSSKGSIKRKFSLRDSYRSDELEIPNISVASLDIPTKKGFLEKKRPENKVILKHYQKRYCVIHEGIFYYFDSQSSKKQNGAFYLKEYEARPAYHLVKGSKKEGSFELVAPGKRSYQFLASSFDEMKDWIVSVAEWSDVTHPPLSSLVKPDSCGTTKTPLNPSGSDSGSTATVEEAPDYVDSDLSAKPVSPMMGGSKPPLPPPNDQETYDIPAEDMEVYDEATATPDAVDQETYDEGVAAYPPPPPVGQEEIYDELAGPEEIYDEAEGAPPPPPTTTMPKRALPEPSSKTRPLPEPASTPKTRPLPACPGEQTEPKPIQAHSDDYENMFYGLWDCESSVGHELNFNSGDIIQVVDRKYSDDGWWTGLLNGQVGLVPKSFLTPAYAAC